MGRLIEKHVTIELSVFKKLQKMAELEQRTMRAVLTRLIHNAYKQLEGDK